MIARILLAVLLITQLANAQPATPQAQPTDVITATPLSRFSERAGSWPVTTIADPDTDVEPLAEIDNRTPGLQARESGSPTLSIRGSADADRTLQLWEGIPLNLGDGLGASSLFIPAEAIGEIRILKGPASAFYATSAMAGAVDYRTRLFAAPAARVTYTDNNGHVGDDALFAAAPWSSGQATGSYSRSSGVYPYTSVSSGLAGVRSNNESETTRLTAIGDTRVAGLRVRPVALLARSIGETPGLVTSPSPSSFDNIGSLVGLEASSDSMSLRLADVRQWGDFDRGTSIESSSIASRTLLSADARQALSDQLANRAFFDLRWDSLTATYLGSGGLSQNDVSLGDAMDYALSPTLTLSPALRVRAGTGDLIKAVALTRADPLGKSWISYAEGYREPSLSDRFAHVSYFIGNPSLQTERSQSIETGFDFGSPEALEFGSTIYIVRYQNLIDTTPVNAQATTKINVGSALASGAELFIADVFGSLHARAAYSYLDAHDEGSGDPLRLSPRHQVTISCEHQMRQAAIGITYTSWSPFEDRDGVTAALVQLPGWSTWDLGVRSLHLTNWEWKAGVLNALDTPRELTIAYPEPQRRYYASIARSF